MRNNTVAAVADAPFRPNNAFAAVADASSMPDTAVAAVVDACRQRGRRIPAEGRA